MRIFLGVMIGVTLFGAATIAYLICLLRPFRTNVATGLSALTGPTISNPVWWTALGATLVLAVCVVLLWPVRIGQ